MNFIKATIKNIFAGALVLVGLTVFAGVAEAQQFNTAPEIYNHNGTVSVVNATQHPNSDNNWTGYTSATYGEMVSVYLFYHNDSDTPAQNVKLRLSPRVSDIANVVVFEGTVKDTVSGASAFGNAKVYLPDDAYLEYIGEMRWFSDGYDMGDFSGQEDALFGAGASVGSVGADRYYIPEMMQNMLPYEFFENNFGGVVVDYWVKKDCDAACDDDNDTQGDPCGDGCNDEEPEDPQDPCDTAQYYLMCNSIVVEGNYTGGDYTNWTWNSNDDIDINISQDINIEDSVINGSCVGNGCQNIQGSANEGGGSYNVNNVVYDSGYGYVYNGNGNNYIQGLNIVTNSPSGVSQTMATLNGTVADVGPINSDLVNVWFEYSNVYGNVATGNGHNTSIQSGLEEGEAFSVKLTNLLPGTKYYYRACGTNPLRNTSDCGAIMSFITLGGGTVDYNNPIVVTQDPTRIATTAAQLNGTYNGDGENLTVFFAYGTSPSNLVYKTSPYVAGSSYGTRGVLVGNLIPGKTYYYQIMGITDEGEVLKGEIKSFTTKIAKPGNVITNTVNYFTGGTKKKAKNAKELLMVSIDNGSETFHGDYVCGYTVKVKNISKYDLENVDVAVNIPKELQFGFEDKGRGSFDVETWSWYYTIDELKAGEEIEFLIKAKSTEYVTPDTIVVAQVIATYNNPTDEEKDVAIAYDKDNVYFGEMYGGYYQASANKSAGVFAPKIIWILLFILLALGAIYLVKKIFFAGAPVFASKRSQNPFAGMATSPTPATGAGQASGNPFSSQFQGYRY